MNALGGTLLRVLGGTVLVGVLIVGGLGLRIVQVGRTDQRAAVDAIVVLGAAQYNGTPSPVLQARLDHAEELYRAGVAPRIVTIGGGHEGDATTEGEAGRQALIDAGLPAADVTAVGVGNDTLISLRATATVLRRNGWDSVVLVTDPGHASPGPADRRGSRVDCRGLSGDHRPRRPAGVTVPYVLRETAGTLYYLVLGGSSGAGTAVL